MGTTKSRRMSVQRFLLRTFDRCGRQERVKKRHLPRARPVSSTSLEHWHGGRVAARSSPPPSPCLGAWRVPLHSNQIFLWRTLCAKMNESLVTCLGPSSQLSNGRSPDHTEVLSDCFLSLQRQTARKQKESTNLEENPKALCKTNYLTNLHKEQQFME